MESEEVRETTKPVTPEASNQEKKTSPKADGGNKKRKLSSATRSVKEYIQKKIKITQSAQGFSEFEDLPREIEHNSLEHQEVRGKMKSVSPNTPKQKKKTSPKADEGTRKRKPVNATTGLKQSPQKRIKAIHSRSRE